MKHSIIMFTNLPKQGEQSPFKSGDYKKQFFDSLPKNFQRKEAVEKAKDFNMSERTVDNILKSCLGSFLNQPKTGYYEKTS